MKSKRILTLVLCAALIAALLGCGKATQTPLRVAALKGPTGMGLAYVMQADEPAWQIELYDAPDAIVGKFVNGELDVAAVPINLASVLYNKTEGDAVMLAVNTLGVLYILENGDTIKTVSDLGGKKLYASGQGSTPQYVLDYLIAQAGVTDVSVEYVGEHAALAAMAAAGEAGIALLPEPQVSSVLVKNDTVRVAIDVTEAFEQLTGSTLVQGCYIARRSAYEKDRKAIDAFVADCTASVERVNTDADAPKVIAELGILGSEAIAARAIPRCNIVCLTGDGMRAAAEPMLRILLDANPASVGGALPAADFYAS